MDFDSLVVRYESFRPLSTVDDWRHVHQWFVSLETIDDHGDTVDTIGYALVRTVDHERMADPMVTLDTEEGHLGRIARTILDPKTGALVDELGTAPGLLVVDSVRLKPLWRGQGLGEAFLGKVIADLGGPGRLLVRPVPKDEPVAPDSFWLSLGFRHFRDDVWTAATPPGH